MKSSKFKLYFLLFGLSFFGASLHAQNGKGLFVEGTFHYGKIVKHHDFLAYTVPARSLGVDLNFTLQTYGKKSWHEMHNYPMFGLALFYYNLGDKEVLGNAVSICPNLSIYLSQKPRLNIIGQLGAGPAYLNKPYDRLYNPDNNAIGSNLNINIYFKFDAKWKLNPKWTLNAGVSFTHYSNASASAPNFGINIPAIAIGARFTPKPLEASDYIKHGIDKKPLRRFGFNLQSGVALKESGTIGGPAYPVYSITAAGLYYFSKHNRAMFGFEQEINKAAYAFGQHVYAFNSEKEAKQRSNPMMIFVGDEFLFGNIGLMVQMGVYISKDPILAVYPYYNKWGFHYYFPAIGKSGVRAFIGTEIKTHLYIADYVSLNFGLTL